MLHGVALLVRTDVPRVRVGGENPTPVGHRRLDLLGERERDVELLTPHRRDAVQLVARTPHRWRNASGRPAQVALVLAVFAPMPSPNVSSSPALSALCSDIIRRACRMSRHTDSIVPPADDLVVNVRTHSVSARSALRRFQTERQDHRRKAALRQRADRVPTWPREQGARRRACCYAFAPVCYKTNMSPEANGARGEPLLTIRRVKVLSSIRDRPWSRS
jgi:hypothetical protein